MDSILVAVHPGYARNRGHVSDRYGNYEEYLSRLRDAVWSQSSMIFLYRTDIPPFELPENAEVMHDFDRNTGRGVNARRLISRLKDKGVSKVDIGGEFLWEYFRLISEDFVDSIRKDPTEIIEEARGDPLFKKMSLDAQSIIKYMDRFNVRCCCVQTVYDGLSHDFDVRLGRDLCYPTINPQQSSLEDLAHSPIIVTSESPIKA